MTIKLGKANKGHRSPSEAAEAARDLRCEGARETLSRTRRRRSRTSQSYLLSMIEEIGSKDTKAIARAIVKEAKAGNPKAWDWVGKYVLGNGKISLSDLASPSILARKG